MVYFMAPILKSFFSQWFGFICQEEFWNCGSLMNALALRKAHEEYPNRLPEDAWISLRLDGCSGLAPCNSMLLDVLLPHFDISSHLPIFRDSRRVGHLDGAIEVFGCPEVWLS